LQLFGEIETIMKFARSYEIQREALQTVAPDVLKRSAPECRYTVVDDTGRVMLAGVAPPAEDGTFRLNVSDKLAPGSYIVLAEIIVNGNAMNAEIRRI